MVVRSITSSDSSSEDPYLMQEEDFAWGATSNPHEWMWEGFGSRPRRLPRNSDSDSSSTSVQEETTEEDGEWVTREEVEHARAMAVALVEDAARIADLQQQLLTRQQHEQESDALQVLMGDTIGELSCKLVENAMELDNSREVVSILVALMVVAFVAVVARVVLGFF